MDHGCGFILLNEKGQSLDAHCRTCGLRVNRKYLPFSRAKSFKTLAQGRPMGLLLFFLEADCTGDPADHKVALTRATHARRIDARRRALASARGRRRFAHFFGLERELNDGDLDGEPTEAP